MTHHQIAHRLVVAVGLTHHQIARRLVVAVGLTHHQIAHRLVVVQIRLLLCFVDFFLVHQQIVRLAFALVRLAVVAAVLFVVLLSDLAFGQDFSVRSKRIRH